MRDTKEIAKDYLKSVNNDPISAIIWCFVALQKTIGFVKEKELSGFTEEVANNPLVNHLFPYLMEFTHALCNEIEEMDRRKI